MPIPPRDPFQPGLPNVLGDLLNTPPPPPPTPTVPGTPSPASPAVPGIVGGQTEMPWVTQQMAVLRGIADRDNWPDWIRAQYGLPPRVEGEAAAPVVPQMTGSQRRAQALAAAGARLRAHRAAAPATGLAGPAQTPVPVSAPTPQGGFPLMNALLAEGSSIDELRKTRGSFAPGSGPVGSGSAPVAATPPPQLVSIPRVGVF